MASFLSLIAKGFRCSIEQFKIAFDSPENFQNFLRQFGWEASVSPGSMAAIQAGFAVEPIFDAAKNIADQLDAGTGNDAELSIQLIQTVGNLINVARGLAAAPPGGLPFPLDQPAFWNQVPGELFDNVFATALQGKETPLYGLLLLLGLIDIETVTPAGTGRIPFKRRRVHWERLGQIVGNPVDMFRQVYHWNDGGQPFDHVKLMDVVNQFFQATKIRSRIEPLRPSLATQYYAPTNPALTSVRQVSIPLVSTAQADWTGYGEFGVVVAPIPDRGNLNGPPMGFVITPLAVGSLGGTTGAARRFTITIHGGFETEGAFAAEVRPNRLDVVSGGGATTLDAKIAVTSRPERPWLLAGSPESHRVEAGGFYAAIALHGPVASPELQIDVGTGVEANPPKVAIVIQFSDGDGFLKSIFGTDPQRLEVGGILSWSSKGGLSFHGSAGIQVHIPLHLQLGPADVSGLLFSVTASGSEVDLVAAISAGITLGPLAVSIENIGLKLRLIPVPGGQPRGVLGDLDLGLGFKPPDGLGIAIDAGPITGGGFISFDEPNARYSGILQLRLMEIGVTAIGLLDTRLPGGQPGYSFLIIIAVNLPPIQLSFGFVLTGIGGLIGINRMVVTEAISQGLSSGVLDHIMFPPDPIRNAPQIISDLRTIFPPVADRYVFGPMLQLAWGTPSLIICQLGVILELPDPVRIVLIGQLKMALPTEDVALVEIHIDVLGVLDFGQKFLSIDGRMHDSRLTIFSMYGDMAVRLFWGDPPNFALSMGGWNPHFTPPPGMKALRRLTVAIGLGDNPRITCDSYFAVTSNSFQFGSHAELYAEAAGFNVRGWIGFDALVIFSPFSFIVDISAGVELRAGSSVIAGIHLSGQLSGPNPWHISGEACLSLFFFDICVGFSVTIGDKKPDDLPTADPWPLLEAAIKKPESWSATIPAGGARAVSLAIPAGSTPPVLVDPLGGISLHEKVLPLNRKITKFGEARPIGPDHYNVTLVRVGGAPAPSWAPVKDYFAIGQFQELSDPEKLSRPSFEPMDAGVSVASDAAAHGGSFGIDVVYETIIVDAPDSIRLVGIYTLGLATQMNMTSRSAAATAPSWKTGLNAYNPGLDAAKPFKDAETTYTVASTVDLSGRFDIGQGTIGETYDALNAYLETHPGERGELQVIPLHELEVT
jgi:hypothetical protein